ncbi:MAG TPA: tetratricopeptide repeat protein [Gemmatimonadaceae bacterium]|nr:tetratricopeptide repeat protein [Gemmatimonadaceae bacterium]
MRRLLVPTLVLLAGCLLPRHVVAQQQAPLHKSDLVRYLTGTTYTKSEIASIVRRNCLAFVPSARDRSDLRSLGADEGILDEVDRCVRNANRPAGEPRVAATPSQPLAASVTSRYITATSGTVTYVAVDLHRGSAPEGGHTLVLRGVSAIPGGSNSDPTAVTDARGRAVFSVPAGTKVGTHTLTIALADGSSLSGTREVTLNTLPAAAATATVTPSSIPIASGASGTREITARVSDAFGNPVAGASVQLRPTPPRQGLSASVAQTGDSGVARFSVPVAPLRAGDTLTVSVDGRRLAAIGVSAGEQVTSQLLEAERRSARAQGDAESAYDSVLAVDPTNPRALLGRGYVRSYARDFDAAMQDFQTLLRAGTDSAGALSGIGYNALRQANYGEAVDEFQRALSVDASHPAASTGLTYAELWQLDPRQRSHRGDVLYVPRPVAYAADAGEAFRRGTAAFAARKVSDAERALTEASTTAPDWPDVYYNRALVFQAEGRSARAAADLRKYLELRPVAADRDEVQKRIDALGRSGGGAFLRGLLFPGLGQFYTRQPVFGVMVLGAAAGGTFWALRQSTVTEQRIVPGPFPGSPPDTFDVQLRKRENLAAGLAIAGGAWLIGAIEGAVHAGQARGDPYYPGSPGTRTSGAGAQGAADTPSRSPRESRARLMPFVDVRSAQPAFGAQLHVEFR